MPIYARTHGRVIVEKHEVHVTHIIEAPSAPNYILGSPMNQSIFGASFQTLKGSCLSLDVKLDRIAKISVVCASDFKASLKTIGSEEESIGELRLIKGPSQIIGNYHLYHTSSIHPLSWIDLKASGIATYSLQAQTNGSSIGIVFNNLSMFVEQI